MLTIVIPALRRKGESRGRFGTKANRAEEVKLLGSSLLWNDEWGAILVASYIAKRQHKTRLPSALRKSPKPGRRRRLISCWKLESMLSRGASSVVTAVLLLWYRVIPLGSLGGSSIDK